MSSILTPNKILVLTQDEASMLEREHPKHFAVLKTMIQAGEAKIVSGVAQC